MRLREEEHKGRMYDCNAPSRGSCKTSNSFRELEHELIGELSQDLFNIVDNDRNAIYRGI